MVKANAQKAAALNTVQIIDSTKKDQNGLAVVVDTLKEQTTILEND
jgi:hypothetical protein